MQFSEDLVNNEERHTISKRFIASFYDFLLVLFCTSGLYCFSLLTFPSIFSLPYAIYALLVHCIFTLFGLEMTAKISGWVMTLDLVVDTTVLYIAYSIIFEYLYGATLGKFLLRLKVESVDGERLSLKQVAIRIVAKFVTVFTFNIISLFMKQKRLFHDCMSKTFILAGQDPKLASYVWDDLKLNQNNFFKNYNSFQEIVWGRINSINDATKVIDVGVWVYVWIALSAFMNLLMVYFPTYSLAKMSMFEILTLFAYQNLTIPFIYLTFAMLLWGRPSRVVSVLGLACLLFDVLSTLMTDGEHSGGGSIVVAIWLLMRTSYATFKINNIQQE